MSVTKCMVAPRFTESELELIHRILVDREVAESGRVKSDIDKLSLSTVISKVECSLDDI